MAAADPKRPAVQRHGDQWTSRIRMPDGTRPRISLGPLSMSKFAAEEKIAAWLEQGLVEKMLAARKEKLVLDEAPAPLTVAALVEKWIPVVNVDPKLAPASREQHVTNTKEIVGRFGPLPVADLGKATVRDWIRDMLTRRSSSRTRSIFYTLKKAIDCAIADEWIECANICSDPRVRELVPSIKEPEDDEKARHTETEARALVAATKAPERRMRYAVAFTTMMRDGEIAGLRWSDIEEEKGVLVYRVRRAVAKCGDEGWATPRPPKTKSSKRLVPVHPAVVPVLEAWKAHGWAAFVGRAPTDADYVFASADGGAWRPESASWFRSDLEDAGLPTETAEGIPYVFHSTRGSMASWLEAKGCPGEIADRFGGYSPKGVRGKHYSKADLEVMLRWVSTVEVLDPPADPRRGSKGLAVVRKPIGATSMPRKTASDRVDADLEHRLSRKRSGSIPTSAAAVSETSAVESPVVGPVVGPPASDSGEVGALEMALRAATEDRQWDVVASIVAELRERRLADGGNVVAHPTRRRAR